MQINCYFMDRKQCVKISNTKSDWQSICKVAAQGSLFGPFMFNVMINDLLHLISDFCAIYNYADNNTICCRGSTFEEAHTKNQNTIKIMMDWFKANHLKSEPREVSIYNV